MKLVMYASAGTPRLGAVVGDGIIDLGDQFGSMLSLIEGGDAALKRVRSLIGERKPAVPLQGARLFAPIPAPVRNIMCVGWNYLKHYEEGMGKRADNEQSLPEWPTFFTKSTRSVIGPDEWIGYDARLSEQMDYEGELAVIIGREGRDIPVERALDYVFGYTLANDITARDVQRRHGGQWFKGKALDRSCPMGPCIVTADEIPDPQKLRIQCWLNGELMQDACTSQMIFPVNRLIAEISTGMTLLPGDVLLTGTPDGVGFARTPPVFLRPGDEVTVSIAEIGVLRNRVGSSAKEDPV